MVYRIQNLLGDVKLQGDAANTEEDAWGLFTGLLMCHWPIYQTSLQDIKEKAFGFGLQDIEPKVERNGNSRHYVLLFCYQQNAIVKADNVLQLVGIRR